MLIQPYELDELHFAYCYRVYLRWRTHRAKPHPVLAELDQTAIEDVGNRYNIHVLESSSSETDVLVLVSLGPRETISACVGKLKSQITKWLREKLDLLAPSTLLSKGYFACTTGRSTSESVDRYLDVQGEHHGYSDRPHPPLFVRTYVPSPADEERLKAKHAATHLQYHVVFATHMRRGVFGQPAGEAVAARWDRLLPDRQAALLKVSFLPDHVHIALRVHPAVSPAELILELMNSAQELIWNTFGDSVVRAGIERLWQPSAYLGSYGDLESAKISTYVKRWESEPTRE
jgi:REP element-mobilizing transposase RayT